MPSAFETPLVRYSRPSSSQATADAIPILVDGEYHIFHLSTPPNTVRHPPRLRSTWSRLRSHDLISWERDEVEALYPGKSAASPDADGAWTGSAIVGPDGNMHLFYTGYNLAQNGKQVILHAKSKDKRGSAFTKASDPISVSGDMSKFEDIDFRDAHVSWNESENCYWMLVATRLREGPYWTRGCLALLTSTNLKTWTIEPHPFYAPNDMFCPECPEIFSLPNGKWYLVYSRFHSPDAGTVYRIADSARGPFRTPRETSGGRFDARRWYAAKSCPKAGDSSKRIYFGWIADKLEGQWSWGGDMGMPREISADEHGLLRVEPCREFLDTIFRRAIKAPKFSSSIECESTASTVVRSLPAEDGCDYRLELDVTYSDAASFGLMFRTTEDMQGHRLRLSSIGNGLYDVSLLNCPPALDDFWADQYNIHLGREVDGPEIARHTAVSLQDTIIVTVRSNVLEVFVGGKSISYRLPQTLSAKANGHTYTNGSQNTNRTDRGEELGIFVEDGKLMLRNVSLQSLRESTS